MPLTKSETSAQTTRGRNSVGANRNRQSARKPVEAQECNYRFQKEHVQLTGCRIFLAVQCDCRKHRGKASQEGHSGSEHQVRNLRQSQMYKHRAEDDVQDACKGGKIHVALIAKEFREVHGQLQVGWFYTSLFSVTVYIIAYYYNFVNIKSPISEAFYV